MKYLPLIVLLVALAALAYWRLRPYLRAARRALKMVNEMRRMTRGAGVAGPFEPPREPARASQEKLVRCASCGAWTPASRAVTLRNGVSYCSHACLERAAEPHARAVKN
ncbi:MAG TPA: hypothetical protein VGV38_04200 [Pyrinomonadaceae bacterium]|nr:hypothetical protein [Pyrinomonadaceae bacterium]